MLRLNDKTLLAAAVSLLMEVLLPSRCRAQDFNPRTVFDEAPWVSARAAGMSEAIDPIANGMEAPYYNPAAIGGVNAKQGRPTVTQLYFPYCGVALNRSSQNLKKELQGGGNIHDTSVADELLRGFDGEHPYARVSLLPAITFYRIFLAYTYDIRAASSPAAEQTDELDVSYREQSGPVVGFSFGSPKRDWYLGVTGSYLDRKVVEGSFALASITAVDNRRKAFQEAQRHYVGAPVHVSALWNGRASWRPVASLVARNVTDTRFKGLSEATPDVHAAEDLALGLGASPNMGGLGILSLVLEATQLTQADVAAKDKLRFGMEGTFGNSFGADAGLSLRFGYRSSGPSFGIGFNLGIFGLQAASFAEDIGAGQDRVIERRSVVNFGINIADY